MPAENRRKCRPEDERSVLSPGILLCELCTRFLERVPQISRATLPVGVANPQFSRFNQLETMVPQAGGRSRISLLVLDAGQQSVLEVPTNPLKCWQFPLSVSNA